MGFFGNLLFRSCTECIKVMYAVIVLIQESGFGQLSKEIEHCYCTGGIHLTGNVVLLFF